MNYKYLGDVKLPINLWAQDIRGVVKDLTDREPFRTDGIISFMANETLLERTQITWCSFKTSDNKKIYINKHTLLTGFSYNDITALLREKYYIGNKVYTARLLTSREILEELSKSKDKFVFDYYRCAITSTTYAYYQCVVANFNTSNSTVPLDKRGDTLELRLCLEEVLTPPVISGKDEDLGNKNQAFSIDYSIKSDNADNSDIVVTEKINGKVIKIISNPVLNENYTINITEEMLDEIEINQVNVIQIEVSGGSYSIYRRYTFIKTNTAPVISGSNTDLGSVTGKIQPITYTVFDKESGSCTVVERINGIDKKTFVSTKGQTYTISFSDEEWVSLPKDNKIEIVATDDLGLSTIRIYSFVKATNRIEVELKNPIETSIAATKILVTPKWNVEGGVGQVLVCNNGFDTNPTWEDATTMVNLNRPYVFTNKTKTATKWGINIKIKITKNEGYDEEIALLGFGGAYE